MTTTHTNKTYLVTGGTTGIGAATARYLAEAGARVIATGRSPETLEAAKRAAPANVEIIASDAGDLAAIQSLVEVFNIGSRLSEQIERAHDINQPRGERVLEVDGAEALPVFRTSTSK